MRDRRPELSGASVDPQVEDASHVAVRRGRLEVVKLIRNKARLVELGRAFSVTVPAVASFDEQMSALAPPFLCATWCYVGRPRWD